MSSLLSSLTEHDENIVAVTKRFIRTLQIEVSDSSIEENLLSHPDFPSLLSISECFGRWKIENAALQLNRESFMELEVPFITSVKQKDQMSFVIVNNITDKEVVVEYDDGKRKLSKEEFFQVWNGSVLLAEKNEYSGETGYEQKRKLERLDSIRIPSVFVGFGLLLLYIVINWNVHHWQAVALAANYVVGIIISALLMALQFGSGNMGICKLGEKSDCKLVLNSERSHLFGISLSEIGLFFFLYNFIILSLGSGDRLTPYFTLLGIISLLSLPFTLFSIYYQWRVVKSWCVLCLSIQVILWLNFMLTYKYIHFINLTSDFVTDSLVAFFFLGGLHLTLNPLLKKLKEYRNWKFQYYQLKNNKELFLNILRGQPSLPAFPQGFSHFVLGNPLAEHTITFVTNPFCEPCAKTHKKIESIIRDSDKIKVNVVFYACPDPAKRVSQHFLSLYNLGKDAGEAMAFWYSENGKGYAALEKKHTVPGNVKCRAESEEHCQWCIRSEIPYTPFLYVNGFVAPKFYDIEEIAFLLNGISLSEIDKADV